MEKVLFFIAVTATVLFATKFALTMFGGDVDIDVDGDFDLDTESSFSHTITLTNFLGFFMGFGWMGLGFSSILNSNPLIILLSFLSGIGFFFITNFVVLALQKLHSDPSYVVNDYLDCTGQVEIRIPAKMNGTGKIFVPVNGVFRDLEAYSSGKQIPKGSAVKVVSIHNGIPVVEKIIY